MRVSKCHQCGYDDRDAQAGFTRGVKDKGMVAVVIGMLLNSCSKKCGCIMAIERNRPDRKVREAQGNSTVGRSGSRAPV
jgi:hypothetical protein